jgi:hypothetical protein
MYRWAWGLGVALLFALVGDLARADSWLPPTPERYLSSDGAWRLTVLPREITSPLRYFDDKVSGRNNAGAIPGDAQTSALGEMEHLEDGRWVVAWKKPLVNEVSPVHVVVSRHGQAVTFDNWHSMGYGRDAIVIYDREGALVRAIGLSDFLPEEYLRALPRSVSSLHWRGEPGISEDDRRLVVPVVVPEAGEDRPMEKPRFVRVSFELATGRLVEDAGPEWTRAVASAHEAYLQLEAETAKARERFVSPLAAPKDADLGAWHEYLREAFFRLDPAWEDEFPSTNVIPLPTQERFARLSGYVGDALTDDSNRDGVIMVASPSQEVLVDVLRTQAKRAAPGSLHQARIYVAADAAHVAAARSAIAHTGAAFVQLDIDALIPQRDERLDKYLKNLASP